MPCFWPKHDSSTTSYDDSYALYFRSFLNNAWFPMPAVGLIAFLAVQ